jgi:hypothetical protein
VIWGSESPGRKKLKWSTVFWAVRLCSQVRAEPAGFLLGLIFKPEDGGDMFFRNVGLSPNYTAFQPMEPKFS